MGSTNLRLMSYTVIGHSSLSPKRPKGYLGVAGSICNVLFNWGSSRLHCWKSKDQLGGSGLQPQLGHLDFSGFRYSPSDCSPSFET